MTDGFLGVRLHRLPPPCYCLGFRCPRICYFVPPHMLMLPVLNSDICPLVCLCANDFGWWNFTERQTLALTCLHNFFYLLLKKLERNQCKDNGSMWLVLHVPLCKKTSRCFSDTSDSQELGKPKFTPDAAMTCGAFSFFFFFLSTLFIQLQLLPRCKIRSTRVAVSFCSGLIALSSFHSMFDTLFQKGWWCICFHRCRGQHPHFYVEAAYSFCAYILLQSSVFPAPKHWHE